MAPRAMEVEEDDVGQKVDKWQIGFLSVDLQGRPITDKTNTGGWRAAPFIFGNECAEKTVHFGLLANFITYLVFVMHNSFTTSSAILSNWAGTSNVTPLIGAFIADAYWGRFRTICVFSIIYLLGLTLLTIQATLRGLQPASECSLGQLVSGHCPPPASNQMAFLLLALYVVAVGAGGIRPLVAPFGADQFDVYDPAEKSSMATFFNAFYFFFSCGILLAITLFVYVSDHAGWGWGFGILAIAMLASTLIFMAGTPRYRHKLPSGSPVSRATQVLAAAFRNRSLDLPAHPSQLYEVYHQESAILGSGKLQHTERYRFLDKAAVETGSGTRRPCTVTQVEEVKCIFNLLPIWATCILVNTTYVHLMGFSLQQAGSMDRKLGEQFSIPAGSASAVATLAVILCIPAYDRWYVPTMRKLTGLQKGTTTLQRIGIGNAISVVGLLTAAIVERQRRKVAHAHPHLLARHLPLPFSVFWLSFQFCAMGLSEVFAGIGHIEFFYDEAPDGMRGVGGALLSLATAAGNFLAAPLLNFVKKQTGRGNKTPWLTNDINSGHLDYYYCLLAAIAALNFLLFLLVSHRYVYKVQVQRSHPLYSKPHFPAQA